MFRKLFGKKKPLTKTEIEAREQEWFEQKSQVMQLYLGQEHDMVLHAILPYGAGGTLDLYYYPNHIEGVGIATKELAYAIEQSSHNDLFDSFELVMFTRESFRLEDAQKESKDFGKAHKNISTILNPIARYSEEAILNAGDTCEFPADFPDIGGRCLLFDVYNPEAAELHDFGLMLIMEIHRKEMEFARKHGSQKLITLLKENNIYPYSEMNRKPLAAIDN